MKNIHDFLAMGGYAAYVWPAYGIALTALLGIWVRAHHQHKLILQKLKRQITAENP